MEFLAGFCFGVMACAFAAAGFFVSYRKNLEHWLTTNSEDVQTFQNGDGSLTAVVKVQ